MPSSPADPLPIDAILPEIGQALADRARVVIEAPPGAGKTTRVPLFLLDRVEGQILLLEPRRLAARAAAERMADTLGEVPGGTVGYRMRGADKTGPKTRIIVITEALLTRMIQADPGLEGVGCVIFDEFHERNLHSDLGLALALEVAALREDLALVVMSATLDAEPVATLMDAPRVRSEGRSYPIETRWLPRPRGQGRIEGDMADLIRTAFAETEGTLLAFLPGEGEIRRVETLLGDLAPIFPLYGALPWKAQQAALRQTGARRIVLATAIAETSLTIPDVRVVVDAGKARRVAFDPGAGMSRLVTRPVSRAEAAQRAGRAGRVADGWAYRLWAKAEEGALPAFPPAEIEEADLTGLALDLAAWGAEDLPFLTPPPEGALTEARALLEALGALKDGRVTPHGEAMVQLPLHPRLAHMLLVAGAQAAPVAALLSSRDVLLRGAPVDFKYRLEALADERKFRANRSYGVNKAALAEAQAEARRLTKLAPKTQHILSPGAIAALAYPDRIGLRRPGNDPRYLLSGGKGAVLPAEDALAGARMLVALDLDGDAREAKIRLAAETSEAELREVMPEAFFEASVCEWDRQTRRIEARRQTRLGALVLENRHWPDAPEDARAEAAVAGLRHVGLQALNWTPAAKRFQSRVEWLREKGGEVPDLSDAALTETLETWLAPYLGQIKTAQDFGRIDPLAPMEALLDWDACQRLDREAPMAITAPTGTKLPIDYGAANPTVEVRLQELFGLTEHPKVGPNQMPLTLSLLSPARRPVQVTQDLPGFWATSYADVRKDMRGRYPKHPWPEDPTTAEATTRRKPRGQ
ncbi:ATP-dependent helicase HrpB [Paracoccaceae bacterium GXU_MW_L88]